MLIIAYILIVTVLLCLCFRDTVRLPIVVDCICIGVVIWFGVALYYAPNHYRGWPVPMYPPEMNFVKDSMVVEPTQDDPGAIYILAISFTKPDGEKIYNPKDLLAGDVRIGTPRIYEIPYSKERQKKSSKKQKKGEMLFWNTKEEGFKIIDMNKILTKEGDES